MPGEDIKTSSGSTQRESQQRTSKQAAAYKSESDLESMKLTPKRRVTKKVKTFSMIGTSWLTLTSCSDRIELPTARQPLRLEGHPSISFTTMKLAQNCRFAKCACTEIFPKLSRTGPLVFFKITLLI